MNTPKKRSQQPRELRDVIRDLRGMLGRSSARNREILLEAIEALQELAHRLHAATQPTAEAEREKRGIRSVLAYTPPPGAPTDGSDALDVVKPLPELEITRLVEEEILDEARESGEVDARVDERLGRSRHDSHLGAVEVETHG